MGYDRETLPPDRDQPEARFPWTRVVVALVIIALFFAISIYAIRSM